MVQFLADTDRLIMFLDTVTCEGVKLDDLRARCITSEVKREAEERFRSMEASNMQPWGMSRRWMEDTDDPEWLVIYAAQHTEQGKIVRDGFKVCLLIFFWLYSNF